MGVRVQVRVQVWVQVRLMECILLILYVLITCLLLSAGSPFAIISSTCIVVADIITTMILGSESGKERVGSTTSITLSVEIVNSPGVLLSGVFRLLFHNTKGVSLQAYILVSNVVTASLDRKTF